MNFGRRVGDRRLAPSRHRAVDAGAVVAEGGGERFEKSDARSGGQVGVVRQDLLGERDARSLTPARKQRLAELDQTGRAFMRRLPALALD